MQDMRSFFGRGIWDTIFLALFDSWRMELPKELKGELLTNDFALVNVDELVWPPLPGRSALTPEPEEICRLL